MSLEIPQLVSPRGFQAMISPRRHWMRPGQHTFLWLSFRGMVGFKLEPPNASIADAFLPLYGWVDSDDSVILSLAHENPKMTLVGSLHYHRDSYCNREGGGVHYINEHLGRWNRYFQCPTWDVQIAYPDGFPIGIRYSESSIIGLETAIERAKILLAHADTWVDWGTY